MIGYTSAEKVLNLIPKVIKENEEKSTILSWIYNAYNELKLPQANQAQCCLLTLENYKAQLCSDIKSIISVTRFNESSSVFSLEPYLLTNSKVCRKL